jgi:arabinan endo-1,5-alpha-L-arabinosidase
MRKYLLLILLCVLYIHLRISYGQESKNDVFIGPPYFDTYHEYWNQQNMWTMYNVHDPSVHKDREWFYMYGTDVSMGGGTPYGGHKRRSQNLIDWEWLGTAFDGIPASAREYFLTYNPNYVDGAIWAPFLHRSGDEFRLYYSAPGGLTNQNLGYIGYATSNSAAGPWEDRGMVAGSFPGDTINAIDPTVIIDQETGQHWMAYGSYQRGLYIVELDPDTGGLLNPDDRGKRIAARQGGRHASIEGPELAYRNGWFYLFVSYDWLEDFYNVRVGRSRTPDGPYLDYNGLDMALYSDNFPMIITPYRFNHHGGWQGTAHCSVFQDGDKYYMANQGRTSRAIYNMVLHVREIFWIDDWPVVSPQRYAGVPQAEIHPDSIVGQWEHMRLLYNKSVPHARPEIIEFNSNGTINNNVSNTWALDHDTLTLSWSYGLYIDKLILSWGWDWENRCVTLLYTGMNQGGLNIWGKKIHPEIIHKNTVLDHGSTYVIRNHHSNLVLDVQDNSDGANVRQWSDTGAENQEWLVLATGDGYFMLSPMNSTTGQVLEVTNASPNNGANIRIGPNVFGENQKWKIEYQNNGYFVLKSKVSGEEGCADVNAFSVANGGNIMQWEYLDGNNQLWRFERIQTGVDTGYGVGVDQLVSDSASDVIIYPNPSYNHSIYIDMSRVNTSNPVKISVWDTLGRIVYLNTISQKPLITLNEKFPAGIYIINVEWDDTSINKRVVVY